MARHRSSAAPLAWGYAALVVYASLYPFTSWHASGAPLLGFLNLSWPHYWTSFDLVANLLGYAPLGALVFGAVVRSGGRARHALGLALAVGGGLSLTMEFLQNFLPRRVPSNLDLALNILGTLIGAALAATVHWRGAVERWQSARDRWFIARSAGGLALLLLWPLGMLSPLPVPLAQGQVLAKLQEGIAAWLADTPVAPWVAGWADAELERSPLSPGGEFALIALGLLAPCLVAFSIARPGWRRLALVLGAGALAALATTLSTALNFGPQHLMAWSTPQALAAFGFAMLFAALLSAVPRRAAAGLGLVALTALVIVVAQAPSDPFFAQSLHAWEQGRFIRFYGLARWVGWLWPYAAIVYLLARIAARDEEEAAPAPPPKMA